MRFWVPIGAVVLGAVAGCGGSSGSATPALAVRTSAAAVPTPGQTSAGIQKVDAAFLAKAQAICSPLATAYKARTAPSYDPTVATSAQTKAYGAYLASFPDERSMVDRLTALGTPASGASGWQQFVALLRQDATLLHTGAVAAQRGDTDGYRATFEDLDTNGSAASSLGPQLGIAASSDCGYLAG